MRTSGKGRNKLYAAAAAKKQTKKTRFLTTDFLRDEEIYLRLYSTVEGNPAKGWVPAYLFEICSLEGEVMGSCDLRIGQTELTYYGGNIGYRISPEFQGHHYAQKACRLLFLLARRHDMEYLIITCNPDNIPSRRTCEGAGGVLEDIVTLPEDNDMRRENGETQKCIYRFVLKGNIAPQRAGESVCGGEIQTQQEAGESACGGEIQTQQEAGESDCGGEIQTQQEAGESDCGGEPKLQPEGKVCGALPVHRIRLTVAYDGTNYCGWQIQKNGITIESELNRCLSELLKTEIAVIGASRTDSGVHALGNIAVFDTTSPIPASRFSYALNQRLPEDIRIQRSEEVSPDWHPRRVPSRKTYEYRIYRSEFPMPTKRLYSYFTYHALDAAAMQEAASYLVGEHDFKSFCQTGAQVESTVRTLYEVCVEEQGTDLVIRVTGNGFLYNMVRIIAGTLIEVGKGHIAPTEIPAILEKKDRAAAGPTAPAQGLTLQKYEFPCQ